MIAADAACGLAERRLKALAQPISSAGLVASLAARLSVQSEVLAALVRIAPPPGDRGVIRDRLLVPLREAIAGQRAILPGIARAVATRDVVGLAGLHTDFEAVSHPHSVIEFVSSFGLPACASFDYFRAP